MNTFIVAIFSQHAGELTMHRIEAKTFVEALNKALGTKGMSHNDIHEMCSNNDTWYNWEQV